MPIRKTITLYILALLLRLLYQVIVVYFDGSFHNGSDSEKYIWRAFSILEHGDVVTFIAGKPYPDFGRMPIYPHFLAAIFWLVGGEKLGMVAIAQALVDSASVFAVGLTAAAIDRRWALPASLLACVWPSFVVYASWVLTDSLFVDLFAWGLCACAWAIRYNGSLPLLCAGGAGFGLALMTRPVLMFFPLALVPILAYAVRAQAGLPWRRAAPLAVIPAVVMLLALTPRLAATYATYGWPVVSTQSGWHARTLVYPCLRNDKTCDRAEIDRRADALYAAEVANLSEEEKRNPIVLDGILRKIALRLLLEMPKYKLMLGVADGAVRSLVQTMLYEVGYQLKQNPTYYSSIVGNGIADRLGKLLRLVVSDPFMLSWAIVQALALLAVPVQVLGLVIGLRDNRSRPVVSFLIVTAAYFLVLNVSYGNAKYGLPLSPAIIVLTVAGSSAILELWRRRRRTVAARL